MTCSMNQHAFDDLNPEKAWMLGWMFADSYFRPYNSSYQLQLTVAKQDIFLIECAVRILSSEHKVVEDGDAFKISMTGLTHLGPKLVELGLTPGKPNRGPPNIPEELYPDFLRGFFDGDGYISHTVSNERPRISMGFRGPEKIVKWIYTLLKSRGLNGCLHCDTGVGGQPLYRAVYSTGDAFRFFQLAYPTNCTCLPRKRIKFEEWFF